MIIPSLPVDRLNDKNYLLYRRELRRQRQRNLGICYEEGKRLNGLNIDWKAGITVQVLTSDPYSRTVFRWVHNKLEKKPTKIAMYQYKPKPDGWGNGGGGLEKFSYVPNRGKYMTELEILKIRRPNHPILTDDSLSEEVKIILAGGLREFVDETGFRDIEIRTDYPGVFLSEYEYPPWIDPVTGTIFPGGHRKITLWGNLTSYRADPIIEEDEIDRTAWFDTEISLPKLFFNVAPEKPYISHVRSTLRGILAIYRYEKEVSDNFVPNIPGQIHPSWWYAFQVGKGDSRFPRDGYKMSRKPWEWYKLFDVMVAKKMEEADNDFLVKFLGKRLDDAMRKENERLKVEWLGAEPESESVAPEVTQAIEDSEDAGGIPIVTDMARQEDEEYGRWYEENFVPEHLRVLKPKPSA